MCLLHRIRSGVFYPSIIQFLAPKLGLNLPNTLAPNCFIYKVRLKTITMDFLPYYTSGEVVKGFGRGSKQLGIPTANFPMDVVQKLPSDMDTGVYYGWAQVEDSPIYKMVMSVGWNPFFKNKEKSMETHIIHVFEDDFYGKILKVVILGYMRPEMDFSSIEELKKTIESDIENAKKELDKVEYQQYKIHFSK